MTFLFTGLFLVTWLLHGYPFTLAALPSLVTALVLDFAPLPNVRSYRRDCF
jgi:hypothetical protein